MVSISNFLKDGTFIKLNGKLPIEKWQNQECRYSFDNDSLLTHLNSKKNYGFVCGNGYFVIDCDSKEFFDKINKKLPMTFIVKTGKKGYHIYYKTDYRFDFNFKVIGNKQGELRANNCYVVGSSSIHPDTKKPYEIFQNIPILELNIEQVKEYILPLISLEDDNKKGDIVTETENIISPKVKDGTRSATEFQEIVRCLFKGMTREDIFKKMLAFTKWEHSPVAYKETTYSNALKYVEQERLKKEKEKKEKIEDSQIFRQNYSLKEILEMDIPLVEYLIPNMLIKKGITIVGGDSGSFKTFIAMQMGLCLSSSISFMGNEIAQKYRVLYIDEENRLSTLKERLINMIESFNISNAEEFDFRFIVSNNIKLDGQYVSVTDIEILRKVCEDFKPDLIILDSLVRFISGDENSVKDVRKFFETLKNFIEEYNTSFLVIYHTIKNPTGIKHDLRGSGDFSAMADIIFISKIGRAHV